MKSTSPTVFASANSRSSSSSIVADPLRGVAVTTSGRVAKSSTTSHEAEAETVEQMRACFARLEELVSHDATGTGSPRRRQAGDHLSRVQLLQNVIDYILDLECTLDFRPDTSAVMTSELAIGNGWPFNDVDDDESIEDDDICCTTEVDQKQLSSGSGALIDRRLMRPMLSDRLQNDAVIETVRYSIVMTAQAGMSSFYTPIRDKRSHRFTGTSAVPKSRNL